MPGLMLCVWPTATIRAITFTEFSSSVGFTIGSLDILRSREKKNIHRPWKHCVLGATDVQGQSVPNKLSIHYNLAKEEAKALLGTGFPEVTCHAHSKTQYPHQALRTSPCASPMLTPCVLLLADQNPAILVFMHFLDTPEQCSLLRDDVRAFAHAILSVWKSPLYLGGPLI